MKYEVRFKHLENGQKEKFLNLLKHKDLDIILALIEQNLTIYQIFRYFSYDDFSAKRQVTAIRSTHSKTKNTNRLLKILNHEQQI